MEHDIALEWVDVNAVVDKIETEYDGMFAVDGYSEPFEFVNFEEDQPDV